MMWTASRLASGIPTAREVYPGIHRLGYEPDVPG